MVRGYTQSRPWTEHSREKGQCYYGDCLRDYAQGVWEINCVGDCVL